MNDTPYLAFVGELWDVFPEVLKEKWPRYDISRAHCMMLSLLCLAWGLSYVLYKTLMPNPIIMVSFLLNIQNNHNKFPKACLWNNVLGYLSSASCPVAVVLFSKLWNIGPCIKETTYLHILKYNNFIIKPSVFIFISVFSVSLKNIYLKHTSINTICVALNDK